MEKFIGLSVVEKLSNDYFLVSASVNKIQISTTNDDELVVILNITLLYPAETKIEIKFFKVKEFSFSHSSSHYFYYIETCKFFFDSEHYYLSLDPYDDLNSQNDKDNDIILAEEIELNVL